MSFISIERTHKYIRICNSQAFETRVLALETRVLALESSCSLVNTFEKHYIIHAKTSHCLTVIWAFNSNNGCLFNMYVYIVYSNNGLVIVIMHIILCIITIKSPYIVWVSVNILI